jgi:hypothetical protein
LARQSARRLAVVATHDHIPLFLCRDDQIHVRCKMQAFVLSCFQLADALQISGSQANVSYSDHEIN